MAERDTESGEYTETYPGAEFVDALDALGGAASSREVADAVGCAYRTAHAKLSQLEAEGQVAKREVGRSFLWYLPEGD